MTEQKKMSVGEMCAVRWGVSGSRLTKEKKSGLTCHFWERDYPPCVSGYVLVKSAVRESACKSLEC